MKKINFLFLILNTILIVRGQDSLQPKIFLEGKANFQPLIYSKFPEFYSGIAKGCLVPQRKNDLGLSFFLSPGLQVRRWKFQLDAGYRVSTFTNIFYLKNTPGPTGQIYPEYNSEKEFQNNVDRGYGQLLLERIGHSLTGGLTIGRKGRIFNAGVSANLGITRFNTIRHFGFEGDYWTFSNILMDLQNVEQDSMILLTNFFHSKTRHGKNNTYFTSLMGSAGVWGELDLSGEGKVFLNLSVFGDLLLSPTRGIFEFAFLEDVNNGWSGYAKFEDKIKRIGAQIGITFRISK